MAAPGTDQRIAFEAKAKAFAIGELIKEERKLSYMTQEQLALETGTKRALFQEFEHWEKVTFNYLLCTGFLK